MCFPPHSKLKLRNPSPAHRYMLREGTHTKAVLVCRRQITRQVQASRGHGSLARKRQPREYIDNRIPVRLCCSWWAMLMQLKDYFLLERIGRVSKPHLLPAERLMLCKALLNTDSLERNSPFQRGNWMYICVNLP